MKLYEKFAISFTDMEFGNSLFMYDGKAYTAGYYAVGTQPVACYWINNQMKVDLDSNGNPSYAYSIYVSEGTVYVSGIYYVNSQIYACYWADGVMYDLPGNKACANSGNPDSRLLRR